METFKIDIIRLINLIKEFNLIQEEMKKQKVLSSEYNFFMKRFLKIKEEWKEEYRNVYICLPRRYRGRLERLENSLINKSFLKKNIKIDYKLINN